MNSKWFDLKPKAIAMRKEGCSLPHIHKTLGIPKSTLSHWLRDVTLTKQQKAVLHKNWQQALHKARAKAVLWHNEQKQLRIDTARTEALSVLAQLPIDNLPVQELALAVLYLAEGSKKNIETALGSSDPNTLRFFISSLQKLFGYDTQNIRCELCLRYDQNPEQMKRYWSKELSLPVSQFTQVNIDKRTKHKQTYKHYNGVCHLRCGSVAIRRRLVFLAEEYFAIIPRQ